jgi:hypothetical protein
VPASTRTWRTPGSPSDRPTSAPSVRKRISVRLRHPHVVQQPGVLQQRPDVAPTWPRRGLAGAPRRAGARTLWPSPPRAAGGPGRWTAWSSCLPRWVPAGRPSALALRPDPRRRGRRWRRSVCARP